jgi:putative membrane protein
MSRSTKENLLLALKGMAMGAVELVPGVSAGTIALLTGIYEEFIDAIKSFSTVFPVIKKYGIKDAWKHINGNFLVVLSSGMAVGIAALLKLIKYLLEFQSIPIWSFFFGLIIVSSIFVGKTVKKWGSPQFIALLLGTVLVYWITGSAPNEASSSLLFVFVAGMLAICAMILPGISGSFILVLLGMYTFIIDSLSKFNISVIAIFGLGCIIGLVSFTHLLSYLLKKHHDITLALLTGFMIGSLNKIWPWKRTLSTMTDRHGDTVPKLQENILPQSMEVDPQLSVAIICAIAGFFLIFLIEKIAAKQNTAI